MLKLRFLGKINIEQDYIDITEKFSGKALLLLCMLFLNHGKPLYRERILSYLWPDSSEEAARYNLRYNIWLLRKIIKADSSGCELLQIDRISCMINDNFDYHCDIVEIFSLDCSGDCDYVKLEKTVQEFTGDFMDGFYFKNCSYANEMILMERNHLEEIRVKLMIKLVDFYEENKHWHKCISLLKELIKIEPYDEDIAFRTMEIYEKSGKFSAAIIFYNSFQGRLLSVLGVRPSPNLVKKYHELKTINILDSNLTEENKEVTEATNTIKIHVEAISVVPWFSLVNLLSAIVKNYPNIISEVLTEQEIYIISLLCPMSSITTVELSSAPPIPEVMIVNTIIKLLSHITKETRINIIGNLSIMDENSVAVLKYLENKGLISILE